MLGGPPSNAAIPAELIPWTPSDPRTLPHDDRLDDHPDPEEGQGQPGEDLPGDSGSIGFPALKQRSRRTPIHRGDRLRNRSAGASTAFLSGRLSHSKVRVNPNSGELDVHSWDLKSLAFRRPLPVRLTSDGWWRKPIARSSSVGDRCGQDFLSPIAVGAFSGLLNPPPSGGRRFSHIIDDRMDRAGPARRPVSSLGGGRPCISNSGPFIRSTPGSPCWSSAAGRPGLRGESPTRRSPPCARGAAASTASRSGPRRWARRGPRGGPPPSGGRVTWPWTRRTDRPSEDVRRGAGGGAALNRPGVAGRREAGGPAGDRGEVAGAGAG